MNNKTNDKNVANIEDDVRLIKRYLEDSSYKESDSDFFKNGGWEMVDLKIPKAIEHLLQDYTRQKQINEEQQKINGELREEVKELEDKYILEKVAKEEVEELLEDSIPKQKIKDKIEELENIKVQLPVQHLKDAQIKVLQELLQESEDK